ncbi:hypothetical protein [Photobacterium sp.]|uniref:hypothetical protein n=1 Tax=Photobacterium sp. TaxID=660 RepID=UPI00299E6603|nr:hypothetical protein [Photobacterium sp.]
MSRAMNHCQFHLIAQRIFKSEDQRTAVAAVIFDGLSSYEAEKRFDLPKGTLSRNVKKYRDEVNYIKNVAAA